MDVLSVLLNSSNIGGQIGYTFLNHLCYADDLCLISLSSAGMQKLLNLCSKYAVDHSLTYNAKKLVTITASGGYSSCQNITVLVRCV